MKHRLVQLSPLHKYFPIFHLSNTPTNRTFSGYLSSQKASRVEPSQLFQATHNPTRPHAYSAKQKSLLV
jgi:hypothetical protein